MKVDMTMHGSAAVVRPRGPLVADDVEHLDNAVRRASDQTGGRVVIDLADVAYVDSRGIETLLALCTQVRGPAQPTLAHLGEAAREALDLTDVLDKLTVFDTVENALRSYKR